MYLECILGRNQISKSQIQQDFADGIQQLDQADAEELDVANFNPSACRRDYDEIASSLPVFCVPSKGYQKLQGVFENINNTEIPFLQAHCNGLTATQYKATCQAFLNNLEQLLNSLERLSSSAGSRGSVCEKETNKNQAFLDENLRSQTIGTEVFDEMMKTVGDSIFHTFGMSPLISMMAQIILLQNGTVLVTKRELSEILTEHCADATGSTIVMAQPMMTILGHDWEIMLYIFAETSSTRVEGFHADVDGYVSN
ncbi:hypothetical protein EMCG_00521 [[Emmonsia] crescens]|uniref:Uncharacterized protein n=1 Tax=[Emmonsia] crescens TaxID=73230 RepID=A0A0G2IZW1_9EURO|nr:hypothetical protein EMCG_00521 [Emmonsia crescens UAMH 3008]